MPIPLKPNRHTLLTLTACLLITGTACNRPEYEGEDPTKMVGDWKLQYFKEGISGTDFPFEHTWVTTPPDAYTLHIKKNGRICSRKNGDRIWHDRIKSATFYDDLPQIDGSVVVEFDLLEDPWVTLWFEGDSLLCTQMPLPTVDCNQYPNWCGRVAVYLPE